RFDGLVMEFLSTTLLSLEVTPIAFLKLFWTHPVARRNKCRGFRLGAGLVLILRRFSQMFVHTFRFALVLGLIMASAAIRWRDRAVRITHFRINRFQHVLRRGLAAMTFHTPAHRERRILINSLHLLHRTVTDLASNALLNVAFVREVSVIRKLVN